MRSSSRVRVGAGLLSLAVVLLALAAPCRADADRSVLESSRRATGFVFTEFRKVLSMGTCFCIDTSGLFITNDHVISNKGDYGRVSVVLSPGTSSARILGATIVKADPNLDLALLRVDRPNNLHAVDLAGANRLGRLRETQEVMALGYPFGIELAAPGSAPEVSVSTGKITALRHVKGQLAVIQFDGSINHGNSGGPLLDRYGNVIGVVQAIIPNKQVNFAIPVSWVRALLSEANIVIAPPALGDPEMRAQLVASLSAPQTGRRAAPDAAAQQSALKLVRDLFAADYADKTKPGQAALVYKLLDESQADKDDPSSRYALLTEARETASRIGDFNAAVYATDALIDNFDVKPMDLMADLIRRMGPRLTGQDAADGATISLMLVEALAKQQLFADARKWVPSTRAVAYASHNPKVVSAVGEAIARVEFAASESERGQAALAKLKTEPNDPESNLSAGQYECFVKDDFAAGCPLLAKGSDAGLKQAAAAEVAKPATPDAQRACGDLWWDEATAQAKTPAIADACKLRAVFWYRQAAPRLTGLAKRAIDQRLDEFGPAPAPIPAGPDPGPVASNGPGNSKYHVTNRTDAREAQAVIDAVAEHYPLSLPATATFDLVKVHDAKEFHCNGGAGERDVTDTYSGSAVGGKGGDYPMLWGIYENWDAGHLLVVYRVQALSRAGRKECRLEVCSKGRTVAEHRPTASELTPGEWTCVPVQANLEKASELEFRVWPENQSIVVDRVYIYRIR